MSGVFRSGEARAILIISFLIASLAFSFDRAQAEKSESQANVEQERATIGKLIKEAQDLAGSACTREDLQGVIEKYEQTLKLLGPGSGDSRIAEVFLQLGRFNLYLQNYETSEAFLEKAFQAFTSQGGEKGKARCLGIQVALHIQRGKMKDAVDFLERSLKGCGRDGDSKVQADCLGYVAHIYHESSAFQKGEACPKESKVEAMPTVQIDFMRRVNRLLRAGGLHKEAERVGEHSLDIARGIQEKRWEASALEDLAHVYKDQGQYDRAFVRYLKALHIYEKLKDDKKQISLLNNLGRVSLVQGKNRKAESFHEKALTIAQTTGNERSEAVSLGGLGSVYQAMGEYVKAAECHERSLVIARKLGNEIGESYTLEHLGNIYMIRGQYEKAAESYEKSLAIRRKRGHLKGQAASLNQLGSLYHTWRKLDKALKCLEESLEITRKIGDVRGEAASLNKLGEVCLAWGQYDDALEYFEKSLDITTEIGDVRGEAASLNNLGRVHRSWGQYDKALGYFEKSLAITRKIGDVRGEATSLNNLGRIYQSWGKYGKALESYAQSLEISRKIGDVKGEASSLRSLGIVSAALGEHAEAKQYFEQVLVIEKRLDISTTLTNTLLAQLYMDMGDIQRAEAYVKKANRPIPTGRWLLLKSDYNGAKEIYEKLLEEALEEQHWANLFVSYTGLGMACEGLGDYETAAKNYREAIRLTEKERERLSSEDRETYFDVKVRGMRRTAPYEGMARVQVMMNRNERAFRISELAKARAFAEAISRKASKSPMNIPEEVLAQSRKLADRLAELETRREKAVEYNDRELLEYLDSQIRELWRETREHRKSLQKKFPVYAATRYPTRAAPMKRSAVREDEWILAYDTTNSGLIVYLAHGKQLIRGIIKPVKKAEVEGLVRKFRMPLVLEASDNYRQKMEKLRSFDFALGKKLADLLVGDMLSDLPANVPVIIIPDDSLSDLPFEMLVLNDGGKIDEKGGIPCTVGAHFLGDRNPVSYYQSVTALTLKRTFGTQEIGGNKLLIIADPVTDPYDERITPEAIAKVTAEKKLASKKCTMKLLNGESGLILPRLIQTRVLAEDLESINSSAEVMLGFDACKDKFLEEMGPRLADFKHIVFATHGFYGGSEGINSEPVLCLTLVPKGTDGLLTMSEVMGLKLNADLVALTACQSGLGKKVPGEGIFQYAGARSVLMSLWSVGATASTRLVETFYKHIMEGKDKLTALYLARKEIRENGFNHPYFWAGLILAGETR